MNNTTNMPCAAPNHKRCDASEISGASRENSGAGEPRPGQGGRDAGGMQTVVACPPPARRRRPSFKLNPKQRARILAKSERCCVYCGENEARYGARHEIDHFVPVSRGGSNRHSNLVAACVHCNREKADMLVDEYRAYIASLMDTGSWLFDFENSDYGVAAGLLTEEEADRVYRSYQMQEASYSAARAGALQ